MKEKPIIFSVAMVRAILEGRKTMTRRIVKPQPELTERAGFTWKGWAYGRGASEYETKKNFLHKCPYGQPGDRLWVRETWQPHPEAGLNFPGGSISSEAVSYAADVSQRDFNDSKPWKPSIHMPRWASRITLEITKIRVERLQEITKADAFAEGVTMCGNLYCMDWSPVGRPSGVKTIDGKPSMITEEFIANDNARGAFATYWEKINGADSWDRNPWVWVVEFKTLIR